MEWPDPLDREAVEKSGGVRCGARKTNKPASQRTLAGHERTETRTSKRRRGCGTQGAWEIFGRLVGACSGGAAEAKVEVKTSCRWQKGAVDRIRDARSWSLRA